MDTLRGCAQISYTSDLLGAAKSLESLLISEAQAGEDLSHLTDTTFSALHDAGLLGMWVPKQYCGAELWPVESLKVIEALSYADGSAGWVQMAIQLSTGTAAAYTPLETADTLFKDKLTLIAGHGAPMGRADVEGDGFRLNGHWSYASGIQHVEYIHTGGIVYKNGKPRIDPNTGEPEFRIFLVPAADADLKKNWDALGLRATGSIDYSIENIFVPEAYTHIQNQRVPRQGGKLYKLGIWAHGSIGHAGFALGVGRRLLDEVAALARSADRRPMLLHTQGGGENFEVIYGDHEAKFRAARALVYEAWNSMEEVLAADGPVNTRSYTLIRLALNHITSVASDIAQVAFKYGGGGALRAGIMQRFIRDMMTGAQHASTSPLILKECAKDLMGMAEGKIWSVRKLIDPLDR